MFYSVRHVTRFRYSDPITESIMECRMQPRSEGSQRCFSFDLRTNPRAAVSVFTDYLQNTVHHFDIPDQHTHLTIRAQSLVEILPALPLPDALPATAWAELDALAGSGEYWDWLAPSDYTEPTEALRGLERELLLSRRDDPLTTLRFLNEAMHDAFEYATGSTNVNSPIDEALSSRRGVCQDFSHIMLALLRGLGIPARYVSGYLYHRSGEGDRSPRDATHAWIEAYCPQVGWVGFDPTNNVVVGDRHIRVAVGRDYADVPPTRGVFKGYAETELAVAVRVLPAHAPVPEEPEEEEAEPVYHRTRDLEPLPGSDLQEQPQQ